MSADRKGATEPPLDAWERARAAYDRFVDLRTSRSGPVAKREREAFIAAMLGTELDANGYAIDPAVATPGDLDATIPWNTPALDTCKNCGHRKWAHNVKGFCNTCSCGKFVSRQ